MLAGAWLYDGDGHHQVPDWCEALEGLGEAPGFVWLALDQPAPAELDRLGRELHLHPLAVEDAALGGQRTKLDRYEDDSALLVLHPLDYADATSSIETRDMAVFLGPRYLVTVRRDGYTPLRDARYRLDAGPPPLRVLPVGGLHAVLDSVVDHYVAVADALQDDLDAVERAVFAEDPAVDAPRIYALKREVSEARRAMAPLVRPVAELARGELGWVPKKARPFFSDVLDHLVRAAEQVEAQERALTDVLSVHLTQVSVQQNEDARKISAWAAMALVPTLIAGIYGMNFKVIPELDWTYGYFYALGVMAGGVGLLFVLFKRSGWL